MNNWKNQIRCLECGKFIGEIHNCTVFPVNYSIPNIERIKEHFINVFKTPENNKYLFE